MPSWIWFVLVPVGWVAWCTAGIGVIDTKAKPLIAWLDACPSGPKRSGAELAGAMLRIALLTAWPVLVWLHFRGRTDA